jgi:hypothetical protein
MNDELIAKPMGAQRTSRPRSLTSRKSRPALRGAPGAFDQETAAIENKGNR